MRLKKAETHLQRPKFHFEVEKVATDEDWMVIEVDDDTVKNVPNQEKTMATAHQVKQQSMLTKAFPALLSPKNEERDLVNMKKQAIY